MNKCICNILLVTSLKEICNCSALHYIEEYVMSSIFRVTTPTLALSDQPIQSLHWIAFIATHRRLEMGVVTLLLICL